MMHYYSKVVAFKVVIFNIVLFNCTIALSDAALIVLS